MADGGLEWLLELNAKLDGASQMVAALSKAETAALRTDAALRKAEKQTGVFGKVMAKTGGAFKNFATSTLSHLTALATFDGIQRVGRFFTDMGMQALDAASQAQRTRRSFEHLLGDEPAGELLAFLDRLAASTEFTDGALKDMAADLIKVGFAGEGLDRALAATLDFAAVSKDKVSGAANAIALLSKVQLKGGISERELVGAGLSPKKFYERLAGDLGIGFKEVEKRIADGKVKTNVLLEALYTEITEKTGKPLGGAGVDMSQLFGAKLEKAKDIIPNLFEELEQSGGLQAVTASLSKLTEALAPDSPGGKAIIAGLDRMLSGLGDLIGNTDFDAWSGRLVTAMEMFGTVVTVGAELGRELGALFDVLNSVGSAIGEFVFDAVEWLDGFFAKLGSMHLELFAAVGQLPALAGEFFDAAANLGASIWQGLKEGILGGVTAVTDGVKSLGESAIGGIKGILGINSPSLVFAGFGGNAAEGFQLGLEAAMPNVIAAVEASFAPEALSPGIDPGPQLAAGGAMAIAPISTGGGGGPQITVHLSVNFGTAPKDAGEQRQIGEGVALASRQAWEAILTEMMAEGGAA